MMSGSSKKKNVFFFTSGFIKNFISLIRLKGYHSNISY